MTTFSLQFYKLTYHRIQFSFQVDVDTFYQPNNKHNSKISDADSKKHNSLNHTHKKAEEGGIGAKTAIVSNYNTLVTMAP